MNIHKQHCIMYYFQGSKNYCDFIFIHLNCPINTVNIYVRFNMNLFIGRISEVGTVHERLYN